MKYKKAYLEAIGYELPPTVISSDDIEEKLEPVYKKLRIQKGQLHAWTGIEERRIWDSTHSMSGGAIKAGKKAINKAQVNINDIGMLIYAGVCRDNLEPATACATAHGLGINEKAQVYDISNACLGILNGMIHIANAIELGQIKAGMVVSCESSRQIIELTIQRLNQCQDMDTFKNGLATMTGGSGAVAVILTHESITKCGHQIKGGVMRNKTAYHHLCRWGPDTGFPSSVPFVMETDSVEVLNNGIKLGIETFAAFKAELKLDQSQPNKVICHQVGLAHQNAILKALKIDSGKDYTTYRFLGNMGTVSLPLTAAIASEREFFEPFDVIGFLGIGSGLNCLMLGILW